MSSQSTVYRAQQLLGKATGTAKRRIGRAIDSARQGRTEPDGSAGVESRTFSGPARLDGPRLPPAVALRDNGFTVFRGLFSAHECADLAIDLKKEAGIQESAKFTKVDATNYFPTARQLLLEKRILDSVRSAIGTDGRFLQVSDLHYLHDTAGWHRDSVHRAPDSSQAADWTDTDGAYGVVKAILYLESENAAMGIMAGSHLSPIAMDSEHVKQIEAEGGQLVVDSSVDPNQAFTDEQKRQPLAWVAEVGDLLIFDERMYHAGRRVEHGQVNTNRAAPKFCLSLVFGADNTHSERLYSYFRFVRKELGYRDLSNDLSAELATRGLVLSRGWANNYYRQHPEELRLVHLQGGLKLADLYEEFSRD